MKRIIVGALVTIITSAITAFTTIKVEDIRWRNRAQEKDRPTLAVSLAPAPLPAPATRGAFSPLNAGKTKVIPPADGVLIIIGGARANGGGAFRSYLDISIKLDDMVLAQTRSYVPVNWEIEHVVDAFAIAPVAAGKDVVIELLARGEGLKGQTAINGTYAIVPLAK